MSDTFGFGTSNVPPVTVIPGSEKIDIKDVKEPANGPSKESDYLCRVTRFEGREIIDGKFGPWDRVLFYGISPGESKEGLKYVNSNILKLAEKEIGKPIQQFTGLIMQRLKGKTWQFKEG